MVEAKRNRNAKVIVVDPRFTRTASQADQFLQIRAGSDIAFLGGLIHFALENNRYNEEYLVNYTNAAFIVKDGFKLPEDGLYSGFDQNAKTYDKTTWNYEEGGAVSAAGAASHPTSGTAQTGRSPSSHSEGQGYQAQGPAGAKGMGGGPIPPPALPPNVAYDLSLQHPRCVFQLLKHQYSRYTAEMVERITGIPKDQALKAWDTFTSIRQSGDMLP